VIVALHKAKGRGVGAASFFLPLTQKHPRREFLGRWVFAGIQQVFLGGGAPFARLIQESAGGERREASDGGGVNPWGDSLPILRFLV
jgi:hypothetical protein